MQLKHNLHNTVIFVPNSRNKLSTNASEHSHVNQRKTVQNNNRSKRTIVNTLGKINLL